MVIPRLPDRPDLDVLANSNPEHVQLTTAVVLWRIHRTAGGHVSPVGTRAWARAFVTVWPDLDGLSHTSSLTGDTCVTLFAPASDALPRTAAHSFPLADHRYRDWLLIAADTVGCDLVL